MKASFLSLRSKNVPGRLTRNNSRLRQAGMTLIETLVAAGGVILLATMVLGGIKVYQKTMNARAAYARMGEVDSSGKAQLRAKFMSGVDFPDGYTPDTLDSYPVSLSEVAPYLHLAGHEEGDTAVTDADVVGPGRTLVLGTLGSATTCTPALDTSLIGFGAQTAK